MGDKNFVSFFLSYFWTIRDADCDKNKESVIFVGIFICLSNNVGRPPSMFDLISNSTCDQVHRSWYRSLVQCYFKIITEFDYFFSLLNIFLKFSLIGIKTVI